MDCLTSHVIRFWECIYWVHGPLSNSHVYGICCHHLATSVSMAHNIFSKRHTWSCFWCAVIRSWFRRRWNEIGGLKRPHFVLCVCGNEGWWMLKPFSVFRLKKIILTQMILCSSINNGKAIWGCAAPTVSWNTRGVVHFACLWAEPSVSQGEVNSMPIFTLCAPANFMPIFTLCTCACAMIHSCFQRVPVPCPFMFCTCAYAWLIYTLCHGPVVLFTCAHAMADSHFVCVTMPQCPYSHFVCLLYLFSHSRFVRLPYPCSLVVDWT